MITQLSLKSGTKHWNKKERTADKFKMKQLHFRDTFKPKHYSDINEYKTKNILESHIFLKEKIDGTIKGRTVAGRKQEKVLHLCGRFQFTNSIN